MRPHIEESLRSLRVAARDIKAFEVLKEAPEIDLSTVCFHAQQAVEKSLKAILFLHQVEFRRTHDLTELAQLLRQHGVETPVADAQLSRLNPFAVTLRYDDLEIEAISRDAAAELVMLIYQWAEELVYTAIGESHVPDDD
jgi:HEPN domain-containing protein